MLDLSLTQKNKVARYTWFSAKVKKLTEEWQMPFWGDKMMSGLLKWKVRGCYLSRRLQQPFSIWQEKTWSRYCGFISETWEANNKWKRRGVWGDRQNGDEQITISKLNNMMKEKVLGKSYFVFVIYYEGSSAFSMPVISFCCQ